jgi:hypothetical protein
MMLFILSLVVAVVAISLVSGYDEPPQPRIATFTRIDGEGMAHCYDYEGGPLREIVQVGPPSSEMARNWRERNGIEEA